MFEKTEVMVKMLDIYGKQYVFRDFFVILSPNQQHNSDETSKTDDDVACCPRADSRKYVRPDLAECISVATDNPPAAHDRPCTLAR